MTETAGFRARYEQVNEAMARYGAEKPDVMGPFGALHGAATADGALDTKTKEFVALGIAIAVHCDGCIAFHVHDALEAGATRSDILDTIGVAVMMGGGPSVVYGTDAYRALEEFEAEVRGAQAA
jgi:AhpD family alkylhydroperoxidase